MFDVGFFELLLIGVVALLVIGPERLPKVARTVGMWLGKGRRFLGSVKTEIEQELRAEELKKILDKQSQSNPLHEILDETRTALSDIKVKTEDAVSGLEGKPDSENKQDDDNKKADKPV